MLIMYGLGLLLEYLPFDLTPKKTKEFRNL